MNSAKMSSRGVPFATVSSADHSLSPRSTLEPSPADPVLPVDVLQRILPPMTGTRARISSEESLSIEVASWLSSATLDGQIRAVWFHPANEVGGGTRNAVIRYSLARRMGLIPGIADFIFMWSSGSGMIELKVPGRRSALSNAQKDVAAWSSSCGVRWATCCSLDEVHAVLEEWGVFRKPGALAS